ncbi:sulfite exporter TauE/SafE family protein [Virgibacillus flavescens]|uniref:sulfite exporter TauE/SafE family protein n=1 Tax=Virgibacillus flavescens TaxID=1611422 RepID=UPI003D32F08A
MVYLICLLIGLLTAMLGSLVGLGGGVILVPSLLILQQYFGGFEWATPHTIVGISLVVMVFTALSSTISYFRKGRVDYRTGLIFLTGGIPGGVLGSWLNQFINAEKFTLYFGLLMILLSLLFLVKRKLPSEGKAIQGKNVRSFQFDGKTYQYTVSFWLAFPIALIVGTLSGLFGIGGGSIMVPMMILLFGFPAHIAIATSMFMIFFTSLLGAGTHIMLGHVAWEYAIWFIPGAWLGGTFGAKINQKLKGQALEWILRILLIIIGIRLIIDGLM